MTEEIIIAGFGGQGVLLTGKILCVAGMREDLYVTHIPSYGAEMRGGTANCSVVVSDEEVASPVIERPGIVIALNGPSMKKFEDRIRPGGLLIWNSSLIQEKPSRTDIVAVPLEATGLSLEKGTERGANMAALGALLALKPDIISREAVEAALDEAISARNRKFNPLNREIIASGYEAVKKTASPV